jgi:uncharacterized protein YjbI with pentapeptide repeats
MFKKNQSNPQPLPFSEDEIQARAFELWEARGGKGGSPENDWSQAIEILKVERSLPFGAGHFWRKFPDSNTREFTLKVKQYQLECLKAIISALGLIATVGAVIGLIVNYQQGQEKLITERFAKAVEQLGSQDSSVRIGSIYALERISRDSPKDQWTVIEVLTAFIREHSPMSNKINTKVQDLQLKSIATDVQAALTVVGRRSMKGDLGSLRNRMLDLRQVNLYNAILEEASFNGVYLYSSNLKGAYLYKIQLGESRLSGTDFRNAYLQEAYLAAAQLEKANLSNADLFLADLEFASLLSANLRNATLNATNLKTARLYNADLQGASLYRADISEAHFNDAILLDADLTKVKNWTDEQLASARLCNTKLPQGSKLDPNRDCKKLRKASKSTTAK